MQATVGLLLLSAAAAALLTPAAGEDPAPAVCSFEIHNASGCTASGHYAASKTTSPAECCSTCTADPKCQAWSFHAKGTDCYLNTVAKLAHNSVRPATVILPLRAAVGTFSHNCCRATGNRRRHLWLQGRGLCQQARAKAARRTMPAGEASAGPQEDPAPRWQGPAPHRHYPGG